MVTGQTEEIVKDIVKQKRKSPARPEQTAQTDPGDNALYIRHSMAMWDWEKPDMTSVEAVEQRVVDYFRLCEQQDMKPTVAGFAFAFGVDRKTMWMWVNGGVKSMPGDVSNTLKKAYRILNIQMENYMQNGKINPVSGIFLMKNNMGYEDKTEYVVTPNGPLGSEPTAEELQKRIADTVIVDVQDVE